MLEGETVKWGGRQNGSLMEALPKWGTGYCDTSVHLILQE